jgi:hypothetical protein
MVKASLANLWNSFKEAAYLGLVVTAIADLKGITSWAQVSTDSEPVR